MDGGVGVGEEWVSGAKGVGEGRIKERKKKLDTRAAGIAVALLYV